MGSGPDHKDEPDKPAWLRFLRGAPSTLPQHLANGGVSFETYLKRQKLALARQVLPKFRIYMDQKYWIYCRDVLLGRPQKPAHVEIFSSLRRLAQRGAAICPVAHPVLEETLKQRDSVTRIATANVVDLLSMNVTLEPFGVLSQLELLHFIRKGVQEPGEVHPAEEMAWTWPLWVQGLMKAESYALDGATMTALQKAFLDMAARIPFSEVVGASGACDDLPLEFDTAEWQDKRTKEARQHRHEFRTFDEVFLIEVGGTLDAMRQELEEIMVYINGTATGRIPRRDEVRGSWGIRPNLADLIYSVFKHNKAGKALPGIRIGAGIHAAIRYRGQPHRKGDWHDLLHARIALPYCSMFLTERNLGNLLSRPPLNYDRLYGCRVLWEEEAILEALSKL